MAILAALGLALPASATTYGTDFTDLWGNQSESGWGLNLIQQGEIIFATMFVYGTDNSARWYSASELAPVGGSTTNFTGDMYETRGPYFAAGTFDPNTVTRTRVGTMTVTFSGSNAGTVTYSAAGHQTVTKNITRFTWRGNNLAGNYLGGLTAKCTNSTAILIFDNLTVTHVGTTIGMQVRFFAQGVLAQCNFNGTYGATGRLNSVNGTYSCTGGPSAFPVDNAGSFSVTGIEAGVNGFHGNFSGTDQYCTMNGRFGGLKDVI